MLDLIRLRADERRRLVRGLRSARFERLRARWRASLEELATWDGRPCAGPTAATIGRERLASADRRVLRRGSRITDASPAEDLHDLRKRAKELRYLLETFAPLLDPGDARGAVKELKALQDVLGTFQDSEAQREAIYALAADMMARGGVSARTILAMGEIAARLQVDQDSSRAQFAAMFERFARRSVQRRMARLGRAGQRRPRRGSSVDEDRRDEGRGRRTTSRAASGRRRPRSTSPTSRPATVCGPSSGTSIRRARPRTCSASNPRSRVAVRRSSRAGAPWTRRSREPTSTTSI